MLLAIFLTGAILWNLPSSKYDNVVRASQVEPGYLDFDNLPDTNFSCEGKVIGGYYADTETGCQMFHVCTIGQKSEITDIKFLCLNGTVFDQETRVCERLDEVDCSRSESFFDLNLELYGNNGGGYGIQPEDENKDSPADQNCEEDYEDNDACKTKLDTDSKQKEEKEEEEEEEEEEYSDWEEQTTSVIPLLRVSSTSTPSTGTIKPTINTSTRTPLHKQQNLNSQPLKNAQLPPTTENTGLQLLALHESFQENLKNRDAQKWRHGSPIPNMPASSAVSTYQLQNPVQMKPSPFAPPLNKLPNTLSNLSQKTNFPTPLGTANRVPSSPQPVTYKSELQQSNVYTKQHSQKVTLKPAAPASIPTQHPAVDTSILYSYNILSPHGAARVDHPFSSSVRYNIQSTPSTTPSQTFKVESVHVNPLSNPTFTVTRNRPYSINSKTQHFIAAKEMLSERDEDEVDEETALPAKLSQLQQKFDNFNPHTNFARAIPDSKNSSRAAVSVVQSTSSVSSSISSKQHSAISNISNSALTNMPIKNSLVDANKVGANSFASTLLHSSNRTKMTEINNPLSEDPPYYEDAIVDYEDSPHEYKDILYSTDVQKIKKY